MNTTQHTDDRRYFPGLDLWRALLLLGGPVVHAAFIDPALNGPISFGSGLFRMAAFFAISGFLGARTCGKPDWLHNRIVQVGVPALAGLVVINPLLAMLSGSSGEVLGVYWFLVALLIYMPLARWLGSSLAVLQRLPVLIVAALAFALVAGLFHGTKTSAIIAHLPFYLLGWAIGLQRQKIRLGPAVLAIVLVLPIAIICHDATSFSGKAVGSLATAVVRGASAWIILGIALRVRHVSRWTKPLTDSAYTIYMIHLPIILIVHVALAYNGFGAMALTAVVSLAASFLLHCHVVAHVPMLTFLLNGKVSGEAAAPTRRPARALRYRLRGRVQVSHIQTRG